MPDRNLRSGLLGTHHVILAALAAATRRGEFCVVVDASDALDPYSAAVAGVELERLLWVRCGEELSAKYHRTLTREARQRKRKLEKSAPFSHALRTRSGTFIRQSESLISIVSINAMMQGKWVKRK